MSRFGTSFGVTRAFVAIETVTWYANALLEKAIRFSRPKPEGQPAPWA